MRNVNHFLKNRRWRPTTTWPCACCCWRPNSDGSWKPSVASSAPTWFATCHAHTAPTHTHTFAPVLWHTRRGGPAPCRRRDRSRRSRRSRLLSTADSLVTPSEGPFAAHRPLLVVVGPPGSPAHATLIPPAACRSLLLPLCLLLYLLVGCDPTTPQHGFAQPARRGSHHVAPARRHGRRPAAAPSLHAIRRPHPLTHSLTHSFTHAPAPSPRSAELPACGVGGMLNQRRPLPRVIGRAVPCRCVPCRAVGTPPSSAVHSRRPERYRWGRGGARDGIR